MKLRALDVLKNLVIATFIISPILLLFLDGEYDKSQQKFPQDFASDKYSVISTDDNSIRYKFTSEGENLIGFDLGGIEKQGNYEDVYIIDENKNRHNLKVKNDPWMNSNEVLQFRSEKLSELENETLLIVFEKGSGFDLKQSKEGKLNLVPIYKSKNVFEFAGKLFERITYGYDS